MLQAKAQYLYNWTYNSNHQCTENLNPSGKPLEVTIQTHLLCYLCLITDVSVSCSHT